MTNYSNRNLYYR